MNARWIMARAFLSPRRWSSWAELPTAGTRCDE
ncbi:MAG: hypothetical protein ACR2MQ_06070 [Gemmatimonadaceae bacterium]